MKSDGAAAPGGRVGDERSPRLTARAAEIAALVHGEVVGDGDVTIRDVAGLDGAGGHDLAFIRDGKAARRWGESGAGAALVSRSAFGVGDDRLDPGEGRALIVVENADLAMVELLTIIEGEDESARPTPGVHPSASVHESATLGEGASVGASAVVEANVTLGAQTVVGPGAVVRRGCVIGAHVIIHPNAVIGADGFGYVAHPTRGPVKVPHVGRVVVGDHAEIGAGTCIDRGKFGDTVIGAHVKIDNLCQIGHNCRIGEYSILCGQVGLAGSVTLGRGVTLGAGVGIRDNLSVGDGAQVGARAGVMDDIGAGESWIGVPAMKGRDFFRYVAAGRKAAGLGTRSGRGGERT